MTDMLPRRFLLNSASAHGTREETHLASNNSKMKEAEALPRVAGQPLAAATLLRGARSDRALGTTTLWWLHSSKLGDSVTLDSYQLAAEVQGSVENLARILETPRLDIEENHVCRKAEAMERDLPSLRVQFYHFLSPLSPAAGF